MKNLSKATILLLAGAALIAVPAAEAQRVFNPNPFLRDPDTVVKFSLSPPGARSLALGGAFLALADDATAAYTNPAGLTNLTVGGSEVTMELRRNEFSNSFVDRGHYSTVPDEIPPRVTNTGSDFEGPGILRDEAKSETSGMSFLSFAYVLPRGLTLAVYRHELGNFATAFQTQGPFNDDRPESCLNPSNKICRFRITPRQTRTELEIVNFGLSGAFAFELPPLKGMESTLSIGVGASYYDFKLFASNQAYNLNRFTFPDIESRLPGGFYGPPDYSHDNLLFDTEERGDDDAFGINLGFLWKLGKQQRWSIGGVFRQGPDFATPRTFVLCLDTVFECQEVGPFDEVFTVPDVIGLGLAYRTAEGKTKILFDLNRVRYSQRLIDFTKELPSQDDPDFDPNFNPADFRIKDADQLHLGVERIVLVVESLFVGTARLGAWREPFHELEYFGPSGDLAAVINRPKKTEIHYSAGFGLVIKEDYQIDFAANLSDADNTYSFSLVKFF
ncbi:MAG TPA: hypothetical protein VE078_18710 [Thermoanaerobaculia bacterium]|nr:hypothetical protein [Thermoanaerobaculia bacterium]